ncbi:hypothetical protein FVR03_23275 [Pontibacter qinzhouensis]|uniref:T9SS type A sorting domain-containing protein n=1 Tax=Pontibacter qinzhouensis TaxID=2603253 RepID=A0A5C8IJI5_9BACT|nr:hypothetical protein [Pontibacter qinzhouensis]TXK21638.1 hypothetical protein FVR03_23275 [Pontibacter qinzhouensis]
MKRKHYIFALTLPLAFVVGQAWAQEATTQLPSLQQEHILVKADTTARLATLSGIHLQTGKNGTFLLDFEQELEENATLHITNKAGKLVYKKPVSMVANKNTWRYNVGKLRPDTYLIEVKTSDTTYWTRFKISK